MTRSSDQLDPVAERLIDAAARVFTERGTSAAMAEVAAAAGVGRATLYRYFPSREALLEGLVKAAAAEVESRIADAEIDTVDVREGLSRLCRGFMTAGARYAFLATMGDEAAKEPEQERHLAGPVRALLERGVEEGVLRADLGAEVLLAHFSGLIAQMMRVLARGDIGPERASAAIVSLFFDGAALR
jgi:TetR/AcrR family transcriptional repressor of mexCD-oprJ operon